MTTQPRTLRPGLLVHLSTSIRGNVAYFRNEIEPEHTTDEGARKVKWETERTISDPVEHEAACKVRGKVSGLIRGCCAQSAFGLICPDADEERLNTAIDEANQLADAFNSVAKLTRINLYVMTGRIAQDDVTAVKKISKEIRELMTVMENGIKFANADAIREAATKLRSVGMILSPDMQARVQLAIDTARKAAINIGRAGEQAAIAIDRAAMRKIAEQRTAFLDVDAEAKEVAAPQQSATAVDFEPDSSNPEISAASQKFAALELE